MRKGTKIVVTAACRNSRGHTRPGEEESLYSGAPQQSHTWHIRGRHNGKASAEREDTLFPRK